MNRINIFAVLLFLPMTLFATIPYHVTVNDPSSLLGSQQSSILANLDAAIQDWARLIASRGNLWIQIDVTDNTPTGRFSGGSRIAKLLKKENGYNIFEGAGTYKMRTGDSVDPSKPDIVIQISPTFMNQYYWIDPNPTERTAVVPRGKMDLVTVLAHELGHGFGMEGWLNLQTGQLPVGMGITKYDALIALDNPSGPVFKGPKAIQVNGFLPPLSFFLDNSSGLDVIHNGLKFITALSPTQNFYHIGRFNTEKDEDSDLSFFSLMTGCWELPVEAQSKGWRIHPNALDAAIMMDLGIPSATEIF